MHEIAEYLRLRPGFEGPAARCYGALSRQADLWIFDAKRACRTSASSLPRSKYGDQDPKVALAELSLKLSHERLGNLVELPSRADGVSA